MTQSSLVNQLIEELEENPQSRLRFFSLISKESYATKGDFQKLLTELVELRKTMDKRFVESDKRFEAQTKELAELRKTMDKRFAESDKRFEAQTEELQKLRKTMDKRFAESDKRFRELTSEIKALRLDNRTLSVGMGTLGNRMGHEFEKLVRSIFKDPLIKEGIDIEKVEKLGLRNKDPTILEGLEKITFDGYLHDGREILLEVKFTMDINKLRWFIARGKAFEKIKGKTPELWVVTTMITPDALELAKEHGIKVLTREGLI
ncbi:MAG: hypothetical protein GF308_22100 [Candidatus Heimdallarchaeota archaeon]|nr:hypothetical protein [Candidatus Heimdallarchaeota archaeon]